MLNRLQKKWKVSPGRLVLILLTFAVGGSLTGIAGKKIMALLGITGAVVYVPLYILLVTLIWPFMVLALSVFTGQFPFFRDYIQKLFRKMGVGKTQADAGRAAKRSRSSKSNI